MFLDLIYVLLVEPTYFENFNLENIVTPVDVKKFGELLQQLGYDSMKTAHLVEGFMNGFEIGYEGPTEVQIEAENLKLNGLGDHSLE